MTGVFRLSTEAMHRMEAIGHYTESQWDVKQRNHYIYELEHCFQTLATYPQMGTVRNDILTGLRSHPHNQHVIYYVIQDEMILIVDILHAHMDPLQHLSS